MSDLVFLVFDQLVYFLIFLQICVLFQTKTAYSLF